MLSRLSLLQTALKSELVMEDMVERKLSNCTTRSFSFGSINHACLYEIEYSFQMLTSCLEPYTRYARLGNVGHTRSDHYSDHPFLSHRFGACHRYMPSIMQVCCISIPHFEELFSIVPVK